MELWKKIAAWAAGAGALYWIFKPGTASAASGAKGKCGEWKGDAKAIQAEIDAALKANGRPGIAIDGKPGAMTCMGAEWLRDNKKASAAVLAFVNSKACGCGLPRVPCGKGNSVVEGPTAPQSVRDAIIAAAVKKGYPAADVNKAILRESGWHARALNCQGSGASKHPVAAGLNGMLGSTLKTNGFNGSPDQFASLTAEEQLPYVLSFISKMPVDTTHYPGNFGLALFTPAFVNKPDDYVIYEVGSKEWEQNSGLRTAGGGPITAGSVRATAR